MNFKPISLKNVDIAGGFWRKKQQVTAWSTIPSILNQLRRTGRISCFDPNYKGPRHIFFDSDTAKFIEAACYSLFKHHDEPLAKENEDIINLIINSQEKSGYLNSYFSFVDPDEKWKNLRDKHELYCAGHLMEAAVAHHETTGGTRFLESLCKYADLIGSLFGKDEKKIHGYPGHEEIELALIKLYRATKNENYKELARYFIEERGNLDTGYYFVKEAVKRGEQTGDFFSTMERMKYWQAHAPLREQTEAVGHAVRAGYLYAGAVDVAVEHKDGALLEAMDEIWKNVTLKKMYITGGIGARHEGEAFGDPYELPNETAYAETCAAIALVLFSSRLLNARMDGKHADVMERAMYNGMLSGVSLDGKRFFYVNPLAYFEENNAPQQRNQRTTNRRDEWFGCSCCPPNIARMIASIGTFAYSTKENAIAIHLYMESKAIFNAGGTTVTVEQTTDYPWDQHVSIMVSPDTPATFDLSTRIPGWCKEFTLLVNGDRFEGPVDAGYATMSREWRQGDELRLELGMPVERVHAHPKVRNNRGRVALQRGPIVYCIEGVDNGKDLDNIMLPKDSDLHALFEPGLLGGVVTISGPGKRSKSHAWGEELYGTGAARVVDTIIKAVPYFSWANREPGEMLVWIRET